MSGMWTCLWLHQKTCISFRLTSSSSVSCGKIPASCSCNEFDDWPAVLLLLQPQMLQNLPFCCFYAPLMKVPTDLQCLFFSNNMYLYAKIINISFYISTYQDVSVVFAFHRVIFNMWQTTQDICVFASCNSFRFWFNRAHGWCISSHPREVIQLDLT